MEILKKKALFNPNGDADVRLRRMLKGDPTNLNDFNNLKYAWVSDWYRQAMNNFWIPEEINLAQDVKDYPKLPCIFGFHSDCEPSEYRCICDSK